MSPPRNILALLVWTAVLLSVLSAHAQNQRGQSPPVPVTYSTQPPRLWEGAKPLPINLPIALRLANVRAIDVRVASETVRLSAAQLQQARVLWLPTIMSGTDYYRHDGQIQDIQGNVFNANKSSFLLGTGPYAVFAMADAIFQPLAQRQVMRSQQAALQASLNDIMLAVAEAYFQVQQARGELAGAAEAVRQTEDLLARTGQLGEVLVPAFEKVRTSAELARRRQFVHLAHERWGLASAELNRLLRLDPTTVVEPLEPPHLRLTLIDPALPVDHLIRVGLSRRPELASSQALVQATLYQLQQERLRPLVPSVLLRGAAPGVTGTMTGGLFGGGINSHMGNFGAREDIDIQVLWQLQNLGFGNRSLVRQNQANNHVALLELFRTQDRIASEVVQAHLQVQTSSARVRDSEDELRAAQQSLAENLIGLKNTRQMGDLPVLISRPQEVVAAVQALGVAYGDFYTAVNDYNRAQFRLYRAVGNTSLHLPDRIAAAQPAGARASDVRHAALPRPALPRASPPFANATIQGAAWPRSKPAPPSAARR
ncbi:MAG TPA: TolC family protein [Pirellulales bacterium]